MKKVSVTLGGEEATFFWKEGKVYTEGYDLEAEKAVIALTSYGSGVGVLLVAINDCCKSEIDFISDARNYSCPQGILELLALDEDIEVRKVVAMHEKCPLKTLENLARDKEAEVSRYVGHNHNCPKTILDLLGQDEDESVRRSVAVFNSMPSKGTKGIEVWME